MQRVLASFVLLICLTSGALAGTLAVFSTPYGTLEVELYDKEKPVTVSNFKRLVQSGAYQNTFFHRLVPGFVVQGGGFRCPQPYVTNLFAPPWINLEAVDDFGQITNEFRVGPLLSNTNRTIAMAKLGSGPDTASCQWFFNLANNSANLDNQNGGFTVFGRVLRDTGPAQYGGLLGMFNLCDYGAYMVYAGWWYPQDNLAVNLFDSLPVTYATAPVMPPPPRYADLFYVTVSLLEAKVSVTNQGRQISWKSIAGKTNVVEYSSGLRTDWKELSASVGTGSSTAVLDTAINVTRFYRVRVLY